jgi:ABC-type Fe3+ transport system substrate-binding protein
MSTLAYLPGCRHRMHLRAILLVALVSLGCGAAPSRQDTRAAPPAATSTAQDWQTEWENTVAAARREGRVVVSGPLGSGYREPMTALFEKTYPGIAVDFVSLGAANLWPRFHQERAGGQYLWDVLVNGHSVEVYDAKDRGDLDPVRPLLVLPEVVDDTKWLGGLDGVFADKERQFVGAFFASSAPSNHVNRDIVPESELPSTAQLVDPRLKGKIATFDPRVSGPASGDLQLLLIAYGEGFVRDLLTKQDIVVANEARQLTEWVVRGRYPVGIGLSITNIKAFHDAGVGFNVKPLAGPAPLSSAAGGLFLPTQRPHPNAARVYANWILTREAQSALTQQTGYNSRRLDAALGSPEGVVDPTRLQDYIFHGSEELLPLRERARGMAVELLR